MCITSLPMEETKKGQIKFKEQKKYNLILMQIKRQKSNKCIKGQIENTLKCTLYVRGM